MTDPELEKLLKSSKVPEPSDAYWQNFPQRVTPKLHWQSSADKIQPDRQSHKFAFCFAGGLALAIMYFFINIAFKTLDHPTTATPAPDQQLAEARQCYHELERLFPNQLQSIVFDQHGPHMALSDSANVPISAPLYLKVCGPKGCEALVTFSGGQIQFNGEKCEVLADGHGSVLLVGNDHVWSPAEPPGAMSIDVKLLEAAL
jgi:hypothetical protein